MSLSRRALVLAALVCVSWTTGFAQTPLDLFADVPALGDGFVRIGVWNLRHINVEGTADHLLPGATREEDFAILTATYAKAIRDLGLDMAVIVEHQPRANEANRLVQIRNHLNTGTPAGWLSEESAIDYDDPTNPFGGLQFGLLWRSARLTVNTTGIRLLEELRQPRDAAGNLTERDLRAPWLVPVVAGSLDMDLMVLHLKSGGVPPQAEEVTAIEGSIRAHQTSGTPRPLVILGDWNIRPDQTAGRARLQQMMAPAIDGNLMEVLTVEQIAPRLSGWEQLGAVAFGHAVADLVPFSHFNPTSIDTFLDHIAISRTLLEIFDHPIQVTLESGESDLRPGIELVRPMVNETIFHQLTDHVPVVLTLRTTQPEPGGASGILAVEGAIPNPHGDDTQLEEVHLRNTGGQNISLQGWRIGDSTGTQFWVMTQNDGSVAPGQIVRVLRRGRAMSLNNVGGDTIVVLDPQGNTVDSQSYGDAASGQLFHFQ